VALLAGLLETSTLRSCQGWSASLATSWDRIWRDFTPRRLATEINTARNRVDRLNMGNLTRETRRQTKRSKSTRAQVMQGIETANITGVSEQWDSRNADRAVKNTEGHIERMSKIVAAGVAAGLAVDAIRIHDEHGILLMCAHS